MIGIFCFDFCGRQVKAVLYRGWTVCNTRTYYKVCRYNSVGNVVTDWATRKRCFICPHMPVWSDVCIVLTAKFLCLPAVNVQKDDELWQVRTFFFLSGYASAVAWRETVFRTSNTNQQRTAQILNPCISS
jgi:hypothetical protein